MHPILRDQARKGPADVKDSPAPDMRETDRNLCLVWGGYAGGNTGDDLTLAIALHDLHKGRDHRVTVLTPNAKDTRRTQPDAQLVTAPGHPTYRRLRRWAWQMADRASSQGRETLAAHLDQLALSLQRKEHGEQSCHDAFTSASRLHLVGGGYLTDLFDLHRMLRPIRLARAMGLAITTSPLGLGPFASRRAAGAVAQALRNARIQVRDEASLRFCRSHQLDAEQRLDDGFRLAEVLPLINANGYARRRQRRIGVCVFHQYGDTWPDAMETWWVECLRAASQDNPECHIEGFCFHTGKSMDYQTTRRLFKLAGLDPDNVHPPEPDYRKAVMHLRRFDGIISTRFHAVIVASALGLPCVAASMNEYYAIKMKCALEHSTAPRLQVAPLHDSPQTPWQFLSTHMRPAHTAGGK